MQIYEEAYQLAPSDLSLPGHLPLEKKLTNEHYVEFSVLAKRPYEYYTPYKVLRWFGPVFGILFPLPLAIGAALSACNAQFPQSVFLWCGCVFLFVMFLLFCIASTDDEKNTALILPLKGRELIYGDEGLKISSVLFFDSPGRTGYKKAMEEMGALYFFIPWIGINFIAAEPAIWRSERSPHPPYIEIGSDLLRGHVALLNFEYTLDDLGFFSILSQYVDVPVEIRYSRK